MRVTLQMGFLQRAGYALIATIVAVAAVGLFIAIGSADVIALLPSSAFDLVMGPYLFVPIYAVAFLLAPWLSSRIAIKRW